MIRHRIFTITGGRTGTAWLTNLLGENSDCVAVHELIGVDDFGTQTPDIRTMRHFNTYGMTALIERFWRGKLASLPDVPSYFESSHMLAKAGLIEALAQQGGDDRVSILLLRRNWEKQIASYLVRNDFQAMANVWLWYLDPRYPRRIVDPSALSKFGTLGTAVWYAAEIEARQEYYRALYSDRFDFIDCTLEEITTLEGAAALMGRLGFAKPAKMPEKRNANRGTADPDRLAQLQSLLARMRFDPEAVAKGFIEAGQSLHRPNGGRSGR